MKEYICKEGLLQAFEEDLKYQEDNNYWQVAKDTRLTINKICNFPITDVVEVVHGKWIDTGTFDAHYSPIYQCSECYKEVADGFISCHKYCLHCGTKMDKEN